MQSENDLIQKLMISKKIMEKHNEMPRGGGNGGSTMTTPQVEEFEAPAAKYNLPQEFMSESFVQQPQQPMNKQPMTKDKILNSKLPDEIKRLMMEHPIEQPSMSSGPTLSNDLVEKASRLMNTNAKGEFTGTPQRKQTLTESSQNMGDLKSLLREVVEEVLSENGLLIESTTKSNEAFTFKVGQHIFEGKLSKIKKIKQQ